MGKVVASMNTPNPVNLDLQIPNRCPHCLKMITPSLEYVALNTSDDGHNSSVSAFWACNGCSRIFCSLYAFASADYRDVYPCFITGSYPPIVEKTDIDPRVKDVSPRFANLFQQSEKAKSEGMIDLAGMGFRKALECLLKDTLIYLEKDTPEHIAALSLNEAIKSFSDNPRLIKAATQARVVGNEYTHYQARYEGYDIDVLQKLISITLHWFIMEIETAELFPLPKKT